MAVPLGRALSSTRSARSLLGLEGLDPAEAPVVSSSLAVGLTAHPHALVLCLGSQLLSCSPDLTPIPCQHLNPISLPGCPWELWGSAPWAAAQQVLVWKIPGAFSAAKAASASGWAEVAPKCLVQWQGELLQSIAIKLFPGNH